MRLVLISDSKTGLDFFPLLEASLKKKIADIECDTVFVPFPEDIPAAVGSSLDEADLVFVFVLYEELDYKIQALLNKLMELETQAKKKIIKVIEESEINPKNKEALAGEREKLAKKWSQFILDYLFKQDAFKPE